jgi:hypothetical protein
MPPWQRKGRTWARSEPATQLEGALVNAFARVMLGESVPQQRLGKQALFGRPATAAQPRGRRREDRFPGSAGFCHLAGEPRYRGETGWRSRCASLEFAAICRYLQVLVPARLARLGAEQTGGEAVCSLCRVFAPAVGGAAHGEMVVLRTALLRRAGVRDTTEAQRHRAGRRRDGSEAGGRGWKPSPPAGWKPALRGDVGGIRHIAVLCTGLHLPIRWPTKWGDEIGSRAGDGIAGGWWAQRFRKATAADSAKFGVRSGVRCDG